jgi:DNA-binding NarL/FixJ family response regulator
MPVVESLKKAHFKVKKVKDIKDIDDAEVKNAQIIFIDFDGVGKFVSPQHQGAGLVKELKTKYQSSKYVVLYTAQPSMPTGTIMNSLFNMADARMRKDSDVTDFTEQIREALKKLK